MCVPVCWSWGFVNRNGKCNCIRERSGLSGSRVWIKRICFGFSFFVRPLVQLRLVALRVVVSCGKKEK